MSISGDSIQGELVTARPVFVADPNQVYGKVIPLSQGRRVIEGVPIWASVTRYETVTIPYGHGDGGTLSWQEPTRDFAIAFGYQLAPIADHAETAVLRIWLNGGLVYDRSDPLVQQPGLNWTFYSGSDEQNADSVIIADQGTLAMTFPHMMYMVFKNYKLPQYAIGGENSGAWVFDYKVPSIRVELVDGLVVDNSIQDYTMLDGENVEGNGLFVDWENGTSYGLWGTTTPNGASLQTFSDDARTQTSTVPITGATYTNLNGNDFAMLYDQHNAKVSVTGDGIANTSPVHLIDLATGVIQSTFGTANTNTTVQTASVPYSIAGDVAYISGGNGEVPVALFGSIFRDLAAVTYTPAGQWNDHVSFHQRFSADVTFVQHYPCMEMGGGAGGYQDGCVLVGVGSQVRAVFFGLRSGEVVKLGEQLVKDFGAGHQAEYCIVDPVDKCIVVFDRVIASGVVTAYKFFTALGLPIAMPNDYVSSWQGYFPWFNAPHLPSDTTPVYAVVAPSMSSVSTSYRNATKYSNFEGGSFGWVSGGNIKVFQLADGQSKTLAFTGSPSDFLWDSRTHSMIFTRSDVMAVAGVSHTSGEVKTIADYLLWYSLKAGYLETDVSIDAGLTDPVLGSLITAKYATQTLFQDLGLVYDFVYFESDGKVKFVKAPRTASGSVPTAFDLEIGDLGIVGGMTGSDALITTINEPSQQTGSLSLTYLNADKLDIADVVTYRLDTETSDVVGTAQKQLSIPIIMTSQEAYSRASRIVIAASQDNSIVQEFHLTQKYMRLEPSDVVSITNPPFRYVVRLDEVTFNGDFSISVAGFNHATDNNIPIPAESNLGLVLGDEGFGLGDSTALALDIPLLTPGLDAAGSERVIFATGVQGYGQGTFTNANLTWGVSPAGPFTLLYNTTRVATQGFVQGALGDNLHPFCVDNVTTITVALRTGTSDDFESATYTELLEGRNAILIGAAGRWELVFFRDVEVLNAKLVTLSGLLRGRRGTDTNIDTHSSGDVALLVRSIAEDFAEPFQPQSLEASRIGTTLRYIAEGIPHRRPLAPQDVTVVGHSAKCWPPAQLDAADAGAGDIDLSWLRRDRLGTEFIVDPQPLSEEAELYDLEIMDGVDVARLVADLTDPEYTYSAADQTTDFGAPQTTLTIRVYQKSGMTGRGYAAEETLDVH